MPLFLRVNAVIKEVKIFRHHFSNNKQTNQQPCPSTVHQLFWVWPVTTIHPSFQRRGIHSHTSYIKWKWQANEEGEVGPIFPWQVTKFTKNKKRARKPSPNERSNPLHQNKSPKHYLQMNADVFSKLFLSLGFEHSEMTTYEMTAIVKPSLALQLFWLPNAINKAT